MEAKKTLSPVDYAVFALSLIIALGIGVWGAVTGTKMSAEDSLASAKGVKLVPITLSLLATYLSAVTLVGALVVTITAFFFGAWEWPFTGVPAEVYANGSQWALQPLGAALGILISAYLVIPLMYNLRMSSLFEYLERRYRSRFVRIMGVALYGVFNLLYMGVALYAPVLAISSAAEFPQWIGILLAGGVCTVYTVIGGLRAVIWTDVFQMIVMVMGMIAIIVSGCFHVGGLGRVLEIAHEFSRTSVFEFSFDPYMRHTTWMILGNSIVLWVGVHGTNHASFQRYNSLPTVEAAQRSILLNAPGSIIAVWMSILAGISIFAFYAHCDPLKAGVIKRPDEIVPYYVLNELSAIYGLPGLFLACLFSGALSTMSSGMNALASMIWSDAVMMTETGKKLSEVHANIFTKLVSFMFGLAAIGIAFVASRVSGVLQFCVTVTSTFTAPLLTLFVPSVLIPFVNKKGIILGTMTSFGVSCWIGFASYAMGLPGPKPLPSMLDECPENFTISALPSSTNVTIDIDENNERPYAKIYYISYLMYLQLGLGAGVIVTVLASLLSGGQNLDELEPGTVHSLGFRIFFPKRKDLIKAAMERTRSDPRCWYDKRNESELTILGRVIDGSPNGE